MNCEELAQLIPDLVDGTLSPEVLADAEATLPQCPEREQELVMARQIHAFLVRMQAENANLRVPVGFEARLLSRVQAQHTNLELLDLSAKIFGAWLVELLNLIGGLIDPAAQSAVTRSQASGA
ncbi:MAG: anti-sigma factor family protein [Ktedonobacteraceae bacterium]